MCWSVEASAIAMLWGYGVSFYLYRRNYSIRDKWYALFLSTFTHTQLFDAIFWLMKGDGNDIPCNVVNLGLSRFLLPLVIFFQPISLSMFPVVSGKSPEQYLCCGKKCCNNCDVIPNECRVVRWIYRLLAVAGSVVLICVYSCSTLYMPDSPIGFELPTILWGGVDLSLSIVNLGIAFWAIGAALFIRPWWTWVQILLVGGTVLTLLFTIDGSIRLLSRMCTYCLLLSFVWIIEPIIHKRIVVEHVDDDQNLEMRKSSTDYNRMLTAVDDDIVVFGERI